jgi:hypothetical protein
MQERGGNAGEWVEEEWRGDQKYIGTKRRHSRRPRGGKSGPRKKERGEEDEAARR